MSRALKEEAVLEALLTSGSVKEAAARLKVCQSTVYNYLRDPGFREKLNAVRKDVLRETIGMLQAASREAVEVLTAEMHNGKANPQSRIYACSQILSYCAKYTEQIDLLERIEKLEENCTI